MEVDGNGGWSAELTAEVADNFFLSAGALDGSQAGATWVAIVPEEGAGAVAVDEEVAEEDAAEEEPVAEDAVEDEAVEDEAAEEESVVDEAAEEEPVVEDAAEEEAAEPVEEEAAEEVADEPEALADTGVETGLLAVLGASVLGAGVLAVREGRRFRP